MMQETNNENQFSLDIPENKALRELYWHMGTNELEPLEQLIVDGTWHEYDAKNYERASYCASWYPLGANGPILICAYGYQDRGLSYFYSSLKSRKNK